MEAGRPHDGFVAVDPEGYYLEFERFNDHPENTRLLPRLRDVAPLVTAAGNGTLTVSGTVLWLYYEDLDPVQRFYERALGVELMVDQGWAKVYPSSLTGFIGLVDGARGLHQATDQKGVTVSFLTDDIERWFAWMSQLDGFEFRTPEIGDERGRVATFVGYDPGGYFLEWDAFRPVPDNAVLLEALATGAREP